jgi:hypothetical protein
MPLQPQAALQQAPARSPNPAAKTQGGLAGMAMGGQQRLGQPAAKKDPFADLLG